MKMSFLVVLLGCVFLIKSTMAGGTPAVPVSTGSAFDCRRAGQNCFLSQGICNRTHPDCECTGSEQRQGPACDIITVQIDGTGCTGLDCGEGVCVSDSGNASCICLPNTYGDACDIDYFSVECYRGGMTVFFNPYGDFGGRIFVKDKRNETTCHAEALPATPRSDIDDKYKGWYIDLKHNDSVCGVASPVEDGDITNIRRTFIVNYLQLVSTGFDQRVIANCYFKNDDHEVGGGSIIVDSDLSSLDEEVVENTFSPIIVELTYGEDGPAVNLSNSIIIDTQVYVTLRLEEAQGAMEINQIKFNSSDGPSDYEWIIFNDGCDHDDAPSVKFSRPVYLDGDKVAIRFSFATFYVYNHDSVSIWITTSTCLDPAQCDLNECVPVFRRDATEKMERDVEITLVLYQPTSNGERRDDGSPSDVSCTGAMCSNKPYLIPIVAGCAGACVLLAFVAVLLCIVLRRRRPKELQAY